jgi:hypothetical protein
MRYLKRHLVVFCILLSGISVQAQNAVPATGGNGSGAGGSTSYTVGQVVNNTLSETTGTITQGVQQPYEISVVTSIEEAVGILLECSVYPNPANDFLVLKIKNYDSQNLSYWLYSVSGILIKTDKVNSVETQIIFSNQVSGAYFLKVTDKNKEIKTFKIIKN